MTGIIETLGTVDTVLTMAERTKKLATYMGMVKKLVTNGNIRIGVFGSGGTGKTTLGHIMTGNEEEVSSVYNETPTDEKMSTLKVNIIGSFWIAPGQEERVDKYWTEMYRSISKGKIVGVINVVSYGYHSVHPRLEYQNLSKYYKNGMSKEDFFSSFLEINRQKEINVIKDLTPRIKDAPGKIWMITLITKQDLWWDVKDQVKEFYENGEYDKYIRQIQGKKGTEDFEHIYIPSALYINNFKIGKEIFKNTVSGYDENLKDDYLYSLINHVKALLK